VTEDQIRVSGFDLALELREAELAAVRLPG